jgi:hypothetical protein
LYSLAFMYSGICLGVVWWLISNVSKEHTAFKCKVQTPLKVKHEVRGIVNSELNQDGVDSFSPVNVKIYVIYFVNYSCLFLRGR